METPLKYRSDVDGLRGIAVLLVVFYHAGFGALPGGFIGVDIFFVISGFLITGIIYEEMQQRRFRFSSFYLRRIKRILPVFYTVSAITLSAGYFFLLPDDYSGLASALRAALFFSSNFYFWKESAGYFTFNAEEMPFLHTWSLAVEEQFYLLWPLMLMLIFVFRRSRFFLPLLAALTILSFSLSHAEAISNPRSAYYLLNYRAGELLLGALLAIWLARKKKIPSLISHFLGILGLALISFAALWFDHTSVFPGFNALIPCLGAALMILSGADRTTPSFKILSFSPLVWVGLVSYSLYLWHWPIFAFVRYLNYEITFFAGFAVIATSLLLSILSWNFVEQPARRMKVGFLKAFFLFFLTPAVLFFALSQSIVNTDGLISRFSDDEREFYRVSLGENQFAQQANGWCHVNADKDGNFHQQFNSSMLECSVGERINPGRSTGLLWGDSHGAHFAPFLDILGKKRNIEFTVITSAGCAPFLSTDLKLGENPDVCSRFRSFVRENASRFDVVYVASRWDLVGNSPDDFAGVAESLDVLRKKVDRVVIMAQVPLFRNERSTNYELRRELIPWVSERELEKNYETNAVYLEANEIVRDLAKDMKNAVVLDWTDFFCDAQRCSQKLDGTHAYYDKSHLNVEGAQRLAMSFLGLDHNSGHRRHAATGSR